MAENLPPPDDDAIEQGYDNDQTFCEEVEWDGVDMETLQNEAKLLRTSTPVQGDTEADMFEDTYDPSADLFARSHDDSSMEGVTESSTIECPVADADMAEESAEESNQETAMDLRTVIPETQEVHGQRETRVAPGAYGAGALWDTRGAGSHMSLLPRLSLSAVVRKLEQARPQSVEVVTTYSAPSPTVGRSNFYTSFVWSVRPTLNKTDSAGI
ncbi:hypothetical protein Bbelb_253420 [Branchiostoma belcheri]|nr:hypothetical protein Bbelb_253420 [Branchiostoma belcheri]